MERDLLENDRGDSARIKKLKQLFVGRDTLPKKSALDRNKNKREERWASIRISNWGGEPREPQNPLHSTK
jgi:hypothetical protein